MYFFITFFPCQIGWNVYGLPSMAARFPHYLLISGTNYVKLQLIKANFTAGLNTSLGITAGSGTAGDKPAGSSVVGTGKTSALQNGCFAINLVYAKTATKNQTAKVLCAPSKADTVFNTVVSNKYGTLDIVDVRVPRRRIYAF